MASQEFCRITGMSSSTGRPQVPRDVQAVARSSSSDENEPMAASNTTTREYRICLTRCDDPPRDSHGPPPRDPQETLTRCDDTHATAPPRDFHGPPPRDPRETRAAELTRAEVTEKYVQYVSLRRASWARQAHDQAPSPRRRSAEELAVVDVLLEIGIPPRRADVLSGLERYQLDFERISSRSLLALALKMSEMKTV